MQALSYLKAIDIVSKDTPSNFVQHWILVNAQAYRPQEWHDSFKLIVSAVLALSLWIFLVGIALLHFQVSCEFSRKISNLLVEDNAKVEQIEKAVLSINDTAKTLYALITPIATAVTGYFFAASGSATSVIKSEKNLEDNTTNSTASVENENKK